jgi:signal peptidase I
VKQFLKDAVYVITVITLIAYIVMNIVMPKQVTQYFGVQTLVVMSDSMSPVISVDDMIVVKNPNTEELKVGDIITFETYLEEIDDVGLVTHYIDQIIEEDGVRYYKTNSEKEPRQDVWTDEFGSVDDISDEDIIGEYLFRIPKAALVVNFMKSPIFLALAAFNIGILIIITKILKK